MAMDLIGDPVALVETSHLRREAGGYQFAYRTSDSLRQPFIERAGRWYDKTFEPTRTSGRLLLYGPERPNVLYTTVIVRSY